MKPDKASESSKSALVFTVKLITEIDSRAFPAMFEAFEALLNASTWNKRTKLIEAEVKGNRVLQDYLLQENAIAFVLRELSKQKERYGRLVDVTVHSRAHYETYALVAQLVQLHSTIPPKAGHALVRRLHGAFQKPSDLRALQFEWLIAMQVVRQGYGLEFPEQSGSGTFDLLATKSGQSVEIECKCASERTGNRVHRREALEISSILLAECKAAARSMQAGLLMRVIVPERFPTRHAERKRLAKRVLHGLLSSRSSVEPDLELRVESFDAKEAPLSAKEIDEKALHRFVEGRFGVKNKHLCWYFTPQKRALVISLESARPDEMLESIFETIKDACDRQLTGHRPGIICVKLDSLTGDELEDIGTKTGDPSPLRKATSRFLNKRAKSHLTCLSFFADGEVERVGGNIVSQSGRSYCFENRDSPFYGEASASIFRQLAENGAR